MFFLDARFSHCQKQSTSSSNFGNPQSLNLYSYVQNNPTTLGDPDGHQEEKAPKEEAREDALEFKELDEAGEWFREREAEQQVIEGAKPDAMIANNNNDDPVTGMCYVNTPSHRDAIEARREQLDPQIRMGGRLGNSATRALDREVANKLEKEGYTVTNGAGKPQEYIPGPNGARKGSAYPDVTATKDGETVRVNTVDTKKDGALTPREQRNAEKIQQARPNDQFKTVPKKPNEK